MSPYMFRPCVLRTSSEVFYLKHLYHGKESVNFYNVCQVCLMLLLPPATFDKLDTYHTHVKVKLALKKLICHHLNNSIQFSSYLFA
jgi:hypothetical protein